MFGFKVIILLLCFSLTQESLAKRKLITNKKEAKAKKKRKQKQKYKKRKVVAPKVSKKKYRFFSEYYAGMGLVYWQDKAVLVDNSGRDNDIIVNARGYKFSYTFAQESKRYGFYGGVDLTWAIANAGIANTSVTYFQEDISASILGAHAGVDVWHSEDTTLTTFLRYSQRSLGIDAPSPSVTIKEDKMSFVGITLEGRLRMTKHWNFTTEVTKHFGLPSIYWGLIFKYNP